MGIIEEPPEHFIWMVVSCAISATENREMRTKIAGMSTVKKLVKTTVAVLKIQRNSTGYQWSCLRIGDACVYLLQFVTMLSYKTLQFVHVET